VEVLLKHVPAATAIASEPKGAIPGQIRTSSATGLRALQLLRMRNILTVFLVLSLLNYLPEIA